MDARRDPTLLLHGTRIIELGSCGPCHPGTRLSHDDHHPSRRPLDPLGETESLGGIRLHTQVLLVDAGRAEEALRRSPVTTLGIGYDHAQGTVRIEPLRFDVEGTPLEVDIGGARHGGATVTEFLPRTLWVDAMRVTPRRMLVAPFGVVFAMHIGANSQRVSVGRARRAAASLLASVTLCSGGRTVDALEVRLVAGMTPHAPYTGVAVFPVPTVQDTSIHFEFAPVHGGRRPSVRAETSTVHDALELARSWGGVVETVRQHLAILAAHLPREAAP